MCVWPAAPWKSVSLERGALIRADYVEGRPLRWHAGGGKRFLQPGGEWLAVAEAAAVAEDAAGESGLLICLHPSFTHGGHDNRLVL